MKSTLQQRLIVLVIASMPIVAAAQNAQTFVVNFTNFLSNVIVPFLFGIAFLFFVWNAFRYFVAGGGNQESQEKAKSLAIYSVVAFVFLIVFWGIINLLSSSLGLDGCTQSGSDYVERDFIGPNLPPCGA